MTDFERAIVRSFNRYFDSEDHEMLSGFAMRDQQSEYQKQVTDVIVFKPDVFIECKALKTASAGGVGFRSHFNTEDEDSKHQIERETEILNKTGFKGALGLELKRGRGKSRKAYLIDWSFLFQRWDDDQEPNSIRFHELEDLCETEEEVEVPTAIRIPREGGQYRITSEIYEWLHQIHG